MNSNIPDLTTNSNAELPMRNSIIPTIDIVEPTTDVTRISSANESEYSTDSIVHIPTSDIISEKSHVCNICSMSFKRKFNLSTHVKTHLKLKSFTCEICKKGFLRKAHLTRHALTHVEAISPLHYKCTKCVATFGRMENLRRHELQHGEPQYQCSQCKGKFTRKSNLQHHEKVSHMTQLKHKAHTSPPTARRPKILKYESALDVFATYRLILNNTKDLIICFSEVRPQLQQIVEQELEEKRGIKWNISLKAQLSRDGPGGEEQLAMPYFKSIMVVELLPQTITGHIDEAFIKINKSFSEFVNRGSGWILNYIIQIELSSAAYTPLHR